MPLVEARNLPGHVGIIMDGNGRWAQLRGQPRAAGHREGAAAVRRIVRAARRLGLRRPHALRLQRAELGAPRGRGRRAHDAALRDFLLTERDEILDNGIRLERHRQPRAPARRSCAPCSTRCAARREDNEQMTLTLALSYGGREEIAARRARARRRRSRPAASAPTTSTPEALRAQMPSLQRRRSGSRHPHRRRAPHLELPALRPRLRRAALRRRALARLRPSATSTRPSRATSARERRFGLVGAGHAGRPRPASPPPITRIAI